MTVEGLKKYVKGLVKGYYRKAKVYWSGMDVPDRKNPRIILSMRNMEQSVHPVKEIADGKEISYFPATVWLEIKLATDGDMSGGKAGTFEPAQNTAMSDLMMLALYLCSDDAQEKNMAFNVGFRKQGPVTDITGVNDSNQNEYMAMVEFRVAFCLDISGHANMLDSGGEEIPNHSGTDGNGLEQDAGYFESAEVKEVSNWV